MNSRFRILMVDDMARYQSIYETALTEALPVTMDFASDGQEALERLESISRYDLVILDLNMPRLDGEQTLTRLRSDSKFDHLPIVILTADADHSKHKRLLDLGANDFIDKGAAPDILIARLKTLLRYKQTLDQLTRFTVDMDIFAAGVLHDVRNLETNVIAITELTKAALGKTPEDAKQQMVDDLSVLANKADQLGRYANEIITTVRATHTQLKPQELSLPPLIEWSILMSTPGLQRGSCTPSWEIEGQLSPLIADRHFLKLALLNIIQNAIKYRQQGVRPHIKVSQQVSNFTNKSTPGNFVITRFRDNGSGVAPSELRKIFEPFTRGSESLNIGGFGLGLALVLKVMTAMGGRVWAELPQDAEPGLVICLELPAANTHSPDYVI